MARSTPRRAAVATCIANGIEWYDFAIYGAMAPVLGVVFFAIGGSGASSVAVFALFASSFLARPLGALVIGLRADRFGRRRALASMVLLMSGATAAIGLLPPWSNVGVVAPLALLLLRLVQGFCSGGEISSSVAFLAESAPTARWGRYGGWHTATTALGLASGIGVAGAVSAILSPEQLVAWGWRLPFLLALPLGSIGLYLRLRLRVDGSIEDAAAIMSGVHLTLGTVWRAHARLVRAGFVLVAALAASFNMWFVYLPAHLVERHGFQLYVVLGCATAGLVACAAAAPLFGALSDRVGRRPLMVAGTLSLVVLFLPLYLMVVDGTWLTLLLADITIGAAIGAVVVTAHLAERFPADMRATGVALSFGLATALVGGTAPLVGSLFAAGGLPLGIPLYLACLSAAAAVAALRSTRGDVRPPEGVGTGRSRRSHNAASAAE